jgi:hypothetical protein
MGGLTMNLVIRNYESRRSNSPVRLPVVDSEGMIVIRDRRTLPSRRKDRCGLDDLKVILAKMSDA